MNSTLRLIYNSPLLPERNFKLDTIDDIADGSDGALIINNFQYIKHSLDLTIKIDFSQYGLEFDRTKNINYLTIQNNGTETNPTKLVGYFVMNKRWLSEHTIELTLHCDTINSFLDACVLSDKTRIIRQHKDRYRIVGEQAGKEIKNLVATTNNDFSIDSPDEAVMAFKKYYTSPTQIVYLFDKDKYEQQFGEDLKIAFDLLGDQAYTIDSCYIRLISVDNNFKILNDNIYTSNNNAEDFHIVFDGNVWKYFNTTTHQEVNFTAGKYIGFVIYRSFIYDVPSDEESIKVKLILTDWEDPNFDWELFDEFSEDVQEYFCYSGQEEDVESTLKIFPKIDRYAENINPVLYGRTLAMLNDVGQFAQNWYMVYQNQNNPTESLSNPVDCFVMPERDVSCKPVATTSTQTWNGQQLSDAIFPVLNVSSWNDIDPQRLQNDFVIIPSVVNGGTRIQITPAVVSDLKPALDITLNENDLGIIILTPFPTFVGVMLMNFNGVFPTWHYYDSTDTITITNGKKAIEKHGGIENVIRWMKAIAYVGAGVVFPLFTTTGSSVSVKGIKSLDRTDPKLIKIIKLPYCPINAFADENDYIVYDPAEWEIATIQSLVNAFKLKELNNGNLIRMLEFNEPFTNPFAATTTPLNFEPTIYMEKSDLNETKLYHSEFYQPKVVYDSFAFIFQLELLDETYEMANFRVQFNVSSSATSKFLFTFIDYVCTTTETRDYNNVMYVSRNNESPIYNQQFINYLRTGYNYDRLSLDIKQEQLAVETGSSVGMNMMESTARGVQTGGVAGGIMSFGTSAIKSGIQIWEMANAVKLNEMSMQKTLKALQNSSTAIIDANDVDLLDYYSANLLSYKVYDVSPKMKKILFDLFYYNGYIAGELGLPDTTSRTRFNFVQAEVIFKSTPNLPSNMLEDMKQRYNVGITFLHRPTNEQGLKEAYDFDQHYENWEWSIINAVRG